MRTAQGLGLLTLLMALSVGLSGCGAPYATVRVHPWPDTGWVGAIHYMEPEPDPSKITNPNALEKARRECGGSFRILAADQGKVGQWIFYNGIPIGWPRDGTVMFFECLDPELVKQRCKRHDGAKRQHCFERMNRAPEPRSAPSAAREE